MLSINFSTCIAQHLSRSISHITSESLRSRSHALSSIHLPFPPRSRPLQQPPPYTQRYRYRTWYQQLSFFFSALSPP
jgi:hypothetical protein